MVFRYKAVVVPMEDRFSMIGEKGWGHMRGKRGCQCLEPAASNPDTLPLPIIRPSNTTGGRKKHDQGDQTSVEAYLATYRQTVITYMANREI